MDPRQTLAEEPLSLFKQAFEFDVSCWAAEAQTQSHTSTFESRVCIASAYQSAACLYIAKTLPILKTTQPVEVDFLVDNVLQNLAELSEADPYFKAAGWPYLIASAALQHEEKRTYLKNRLFMTWSRFGWGVILAAIEMLQLMWKLRDEESITAVA